MKKTLFTIAIGLFSLTIQAQTFIPNAPFVGQINGSYLDPEFSEAVYQVVFQDMQNRLWIGDLDSITGLFKTATGFDYLMDINLPLVMGDKNQPGKKFATNGPEWAKDTNGSFVVYTRLDSNGLMQQFMAKLENAVPKIQQLTKQPFDCYGNMPSRFEDGKPTRIAFTYDWPIWKAKAAWVFIDKPEVFNTVPGFDYMKMSMWSNVSADFLFVYRKDSLSTGQIACADANTGKINVLTKDAGEKDDPGMFFAPEYGGEKLLIANVNNSELGIYRDMKSPDSTWTRMATLRLPVDTPYKFISSPEVISPFTGIGGISYFSLLARESKDRSSSGGIWVFGLGNDSNNRFIRRIDDGAITDFKAIRIEPEPFAGKNEIFVYYNYYEMKTGQHGLRRASTGIQINTSGIQNEIKFPEIKVYPNPVNTTLFIQGQTENISQYEIVNIFGQYVQKGIIINQNIDIYNLATGIFFIRFKTKDNQFQNYKFIKE